MWSVQTLRVVAQLSTTGLQIPVMFFLAQGFAGSGSTSAGASLVMSIAGGIGLAVFFLLCVLGKHCHHRCRQRALAPTRNGAKLNVAWLFSNTNINCQLRAHSPVAHTLHLVTACVAMRLYHPCCMHYHVVWQ